MKYEDAKEIIEANSPEQFKQAVKVGFEPISSGLKMMRIETEASKISRPVYILGKK